MTWKSAILAGVATLWVATPAFSDTPALETFPGPKGDYYRAPPGYLWENEEYEFTLLIPKGAEGCTDDGILSSHGLVIGSKDVSCLNVFKYPSVGIYGEYIIAPTSKKKLIKIGCGNHLAKNSNIKIDGYSFFKCWGKSDNQNDNSRYMDYFTFREPGLGEEIDIYIFCPTIGNCSRWVAKWERLIFENLHIHW